MNCILGYFESETKDVKEEIEIVEQSMKQESDIEVFNVSEDLNLDDIIINYVKKEIKIEPTCLVYKS